MHLITWKKLKDFSEKYPDAKNRLLEIRQIITKNDFKNCRELQCKLSDAECVGDNRVVINVRRNNYRLVLSVNYITRIAYVRFIGTHKEYDKIDVTSI